ncbi:hypothetical protein K450DRAFT_218041 [Umbelopsis ramanniana AG]|uniref:Exonuclease domain-containing protein n=1 Tax=Umbelopsis ramanniana AG TaxID=1314678 RepID=A0AAD5EK27_UMBRA|nr:uncharacterized protein K450DRAFT_218041 [Umbelopsis ramanniana AG]KAI8584794.1 hypothetical protein K450DRAFT_218041 [Umbelopsis ramanniana AG]
MFPALGLFRSITCPEYPGCHRSSCLYSHEVTEEHIAKKRKVEATRSRQETERAPIAQISKYATSTQVRPVAKGHAGPAAAYDIRPSAAKLPSNLSTTAEAKPAYRNIISGVSETKMKPTATISNRSSTGSNLSHSVPVPVLQAKSTTGGPPMILPDLKSQVPQKVRQMTVTRMYEQFLRIYKPLDEHMLLAFQDSEKQERKIHETSVNQAGYKQTAAGVLGRLKKRLPSEDKDDIGIDGEWTDKKSQQKTGMRSKLQQYVLTEEQLAKMNYPLADALEIPQSIDSSVGIERKCDRCTKAFIVKDILTKQDMELCRYHHGRIRKVKVHGEYERLYYCCNSPPESLGCTTGPHVYKDETIEALAKRIPFSSVKPVSGASKDVRQIIALDCEMAYTTAGMELVRISAIDEFNETIIDELVLPQHMVVDLNSRYSGIQTLRGAKYNLQDIHLMLSKFMDEQTILAGHGLENDLKALRIVHPNVVDTVALYPHPNGLPYRHGLRFLANKYLQRFIQDSSEGHDSFEDAKTSLDLIKLKVEKGKQFGSN